MHLIIHLCYHFFILLTCMSTNSVQEFAAFGVPQVQSAVITAGEQNLTVRRERAAVHLTQVRIFWLIKWKKQNSF